MTFIAGWETEGIVF